jgi:hypothetical protein
LPFFALARHGGFWNGASNWQIISRHKELADARLACEGHVSERG